MKILIWLLIIAGDKEAICENVDPTETRPDVTHAPANYFEGEAI